MLFFANFRKNPIYLEKPRNNRSVQSANKNIFKNIIKMKQIF